MVEDAMLLSAHLSAFHLLLQRLPAPLAKATAIAALQKAVERGHVSATALFLHIAGVDQVCRGYLAHTAAEHGSPTVLQLLLEGCTISAANLNVRLITSARRCKAACVSGCLTHGARVNAMTSFLLYVAVKLEVPTSGDPTEQDRLDTVRSGSSCVMHPQCQRT